MWLTERMFVDYVMPLGEAYRGARERFLRLTEGDLLDGMSRDAYAGGLAGRLKVLKARSAMVPEGPKSRASGRNGPARRGCG